MKNTTKKKTLIFSLIGVGVLLVVALFLIIYGNLTHSETVFMTTCVRGDKVYYVDTGSSDFDEGETLSVEECENLTSSLWSKSSFPLKVQVTNHTGEILPFDHRAWKVVDHALEDMNNYFGFPLFQKAPPHKAGTVTVIWGVPYTSEVNGKAAGYVSHYYVRSSETELIQDTGCDSSGLCAKVGLRDISSDRSAYIVLKHEFGHILFLGHDDYTASVMYPLSFDDILSQSITNWTRFSDTDHKAIRDQYLP